MILYRKSSNMWGTRKDFKTSNTQQHKAKGLVDILIRWLWFSMSTRNVIGSDYPLQTKIGWHDQRCIE